MERKIPAYNQNNLRPPLAADGGAGQGALPFRDAGGEKLLHYIWQFGYFNRSQLTTVEGEPLTLISPGRLNVNGGPDFTNAKIKIGDTVLAGQVELHLKTSDWERHQHQYDPAYRNVVLHVVFQHDKDLHHSIPVLELEPRLSTLLLERYFNFMNAGTFIPCHTSIQAVKDLVWMAWKERLLAERLTRKCHAIFSLLAESNYNWEEVLWWLIARNFGLTVNCDAFEAVARSVSINILAKHKASPHQMEALLFGQAGLLKGSFTEDYPRLLQREYAYLQKKLSLQPVPIPVQFLRMRPGAFPTIRLAQLAELMQQSSHLFSRVVEAVSVQQVQAILSVRLPEYWHSHYLFDHPSAHRTKTIGSETIAGIVINAFIPLIFAYGQYHHNERCKEKALRWLEELHPENNRIVRGFKTVGITAMNAYDTQALVELKNEYCTPKKCLYCAVGNDLLKREVPPASHEKPAAP